MSHDHGEIYQRLNRIDTTLAGQTVEMQRLREDVQELVRVVVKGNGESLVTRLRIVERDVAAHASHIAGCRAGRSELDREGVRGRWSAVVAGIAAAGAVVGGLVATLARHLFAGGGS